MPVPLDVPSFRRLKAEDQEFRWPVKYCDYLSLVKAFRVEVIKSLDMQPLEKDERVAIQAVLGTILNDGEKILKSLQEVENLELSGDEFIFDEQHSPLFGFLRAANSVEVYKLKQKIDKSGISKHRKTITRAFKDVLAWWCTCVQMFLTRKCDRYDLQNEAALFLEFSSGKQEKIQLLRPERWPLPTTAFISQRSKEISAQLASAFRRVLKHRHFHPERTECAALIFQEQVLEQLTVAMGELAWLDNARLVRLFGKALIGGTPKRIGRLIASKYVQSGKEVIRFSHGGDRVFFDDPFWPETELPFVTEYYVHGDKAADLFNARYKAKPHTFASNVPKFTSVGSAKHAAWYHRDKIGKTNRNDKLRVVFVPGSFLGEESFASVDFKLPDVLAVDVQRKITRSLLDAGFDAWIKPHPKGLFSLAGQAEVDGARVLKGAFNPTEIEADCFVFEFAGSAFFDALASRKGVVLIDTKQREWDESAKIELKKRCEIVPASFDDYNRLQVSVSKLKEAIERASNGQGCTSEFAHKFFVGKKATND